MKRSTFVPMFSYFGAKWQNAWRYPKPEHRTIVEPFAGAAGYATNYFRRKVVLVEKSPIIAGVWRWLLKATPKEILGLPLFDAGQLISDVPGLTPEQRAFLGFRCGRGSQSPRDKVSPWGAKNGPAGAWTDHARMVLAAQIPLISHWTIIEGDYWKVPMGSGFEATWFIDPPYQKEGFRYLESSKKLDFVALGEWCRERRGLTIACEQEGADWLPFVPLYDMRGTSAVANAKNGRAKKTTTTEVVWVNRTS